MVSPFSSLFAETCHKNLCTGSFVFVCFIPILKCTFNAILHSFARSIILESTKRRNWPSLRMNLSSWWRLLVRSNPTCPSPSRRRYFCPNRSATFVTFWLLKGQLRPLVVCFSTFLPFFSLSLSLAFSPPVQSSIPLRSRSKKTRRRSVWRGGC